MKKMILIGRSGSGKTTLTQVLKGKKIKYDKTQYINYHDFIIDTPGEYAENKELARALALYSYEADIVGLLLSATEQYSLFSPNITCMANREVIGIVTKADHKDADVQRAERWLRLSGCKKVFKVSAYTGEGIEDIIEYLKN
jgi:ethanolamine utilization protein EutP